MPGRAVGGFDFLFILVEFLSTYERKMVQLKAIGRTINCQKIKMKALGKVHEISVSKGIVHTVHSDNLRFNKGANMS